MDLFGHNRQSENGNSVDRIRSLLQRSSCRCHRGKCLQKFTDMINLLMKFLNVFWSLEKPAQDAYDWNLVFLLPCAARQQEQGCEIKQFWTNVQFEETYFDHVVSWLGLRSMREWSPVCLRTEHGCCAANELPPSAWQPYLGSGPRGYSQLGRGNWIVGIDVLGQYLDQLQ